MMFTLGFALLSTHAQAQHSGVYEGQEWLTMDPGKGNCGLGKVRVEVSETTLRLKRIRDPKTYKLPVTWNGDAFSGEANGGFSLRGHIDGDRMLWDMQGVWCAWHYDLRRTE